MSRRRADSDPDGADLFASPLVHDKEAERALVGAMIISGELAPLVVSGGLADDDFHGHVTRSAYRAIRSLVERGAVPDLSNIVRECYAIGADDVTAADVAGLTDGVPRATNWPHYLARVRESGVRRRLAREFAAYLRRLATDPVDEIRRDAYALLDQADASVRPPAADRWAVLSAEIGSRYESGADDRVPTGIAGVDQTFGPVARGSLVIIGARTSVGKTSLATTLAIEQARAARRVSFVSREMDRILIGHRYLGAMTGLRVTDFQARSLSERDLQAWCGALIEPLQLCTDDRARSWSQARARIRQHGRELGGLDVAFVDYIQLLDPEQRPGEKRYEALGRVATGLKDLARDLGCVVFACAQLSRGADERDEPRLSDLRESGNLEQDADQVWLIYRRERDAQTVPGLTPIRLRVAKNRNGPTGEVTVHFRPAAMRFEEYEEGL